MPNFTWEYFTKKQDIKQKTQDNNHHLHTCLHHETYESYLLSLKKKALTFLHEVVLGFDFDDFWEKQDDALFKHYLNEFQKPIKDLFDDNEYADLKAKFTQNAYEFALAKARTLLEKSKELNKADAKALFERMEKYNDTEKTQFALAIQAAQEWQQILKDEDIFPNLEYRAVMDENTRESHAKLNGIIRPLRDDFWNRYFPPIDYRCRCTIRQRDKKAKITEKLPEKLPAIPKGLRHNPGNSGKTFDFEHPYFESTTDEIITKEIRRHALIKARERLKDVVIKNIFEIKFTVKGLKEAINQPASDYNLKNILIAENIEDVLKNAKYLGKEYPKNNKQHLKFLHFFIFLLKTYIL